MAFMPLQLTGTVVPANATNQTITWSLVNGGTTGAIIGGSFLFTSAEGTAIIKATIKDGVSAGTDYVQEFEILVSSVGINNELGTKNYELIIYPNPAKDELRVENGELKMEKITVYNSVGQIVMAVSSVNATSYSLNVERLNSGLYFISVQTKDGVVNGKFVVK